MISLKNTICRFVWARYLHWPKAQDMNLYRFAQLTILITRNASAAAHIRTSKPDVPAPGGPLPPGRAAGPYYLPDYKDLSRMTGGIRSKSGHLPSRKPLVLSGLGPRRPRDWQFRGDRHSRPGPGPGCSPCVR
jgi:hypothetical protein